MYLGPSDVIAHDAGRNFMIEAFKLNPNMLQLNTKSIPVEAAHSMTIVESCHALFRRDLKTIKTGSMDLGKEDIVYMAVKDANDSVDPEGIVSTLLVIRALPCLELPTDKPKPSTFQRALVLQKAAESMPRHFAKRQVRGADSSENCSNFTGIQITPANTPVLVYRPH